MTVILGLSGGHDANWCVVDGSGIIGAFEKERFTRKRHDAGNVVQLAHESLTRLGISRCNIDLIATSEPVKKGAEAGIKLLGGQKYRYPDRWEHQVVDVFDRIYPCISVPHHLSHAAYGYYTSPFSNCVIVSIDGGGDFYTEEAYTSAAVSVWRGGKLNYFVPVPNLDYGSLWHTYALALFGDGNHAGKLMGLAAYGDDRLVQPFWDRFTAPATGLFAGARLVKSCWPDHFDPPFLKGADGWHSPQSKAIARAVQDVTTASALDFLQHVRTNTGEANLVLTGGVALNGYMNAAVALSGMFDSVHVPPAVHDGGISLGAALFSANHVLGGTVRAGDLDLGCIGHTYDTTGAGLELPDYARRVPNEDGAQLVARKLAEGGILGVFSGRSEHGPRALGNRSILASASLPGIRDRLNGHIKRRESFRPLGPIMLDADAPTYFPDCPSSPYMMFIHKGNEKFQSEAPQAAHVDGTARLQTVSDRRFVAQVLEAYKQIGAGNVLINTSLNIGTPIAETPQDAVSAYEKGSLDALWLDGWWIERPG